MNVDEMEAGRKLDALVAEKVMGVKPEQVYCDISGRSISRYFDLEDRMRIESYSTDIAAAWQVLERVAESWLPCVMHDGMMWVAEFDSIIECHTAYADTAPLAICRCALKTVDKETTDDRDNQTGT